MIIKAILFDFGGTLDTNGVHWSEMFWELYEQFKIRIYKSQFYEAFVYSDKKIGKMNVIKNFNLLNTITLQLEEQFHFLNKRYGYVKYYPRTINDMAYRLYSLVSENLNLNRLLLKELKRNYKLGLISNFTGNLSIICREFGYHKIFDSIIDSAIVGIKKPDPEIFMLALDMLEAHPEETLVIGDSYENDIVPAKRIGCNTLWLDGKSWYRPKSTIDADFTISDLNSLNSIINNFFYIQEGELWEINL